MAEIIILALLVVWSHGLASRLARVDSSLSFWSSLFARFWFRPFRSEMPHIVRVPLRVAVDIQNATCCPPFFSPHRIRNNLQPMVSRGLSNISKE